MESHLRIKGKFITKETTNDTYVVELHDDNYLVDKLEYPAKWGKIATPNGYTKGPEGARQHAKDHWF